MDKPVMKTKSEIGRSSRQAGVAFERKIANALRDAGLPAERCIAQSRSAKREGCDVEGSDWWIECKQGAAPDVVRAYAQACDDSDGRPAVVIWRKGRGPVCATASLGSLAMGTPSTTPAIWLALATVSLADWIRIAKYGGL